MSATKALVFAGYFGLIGYTVAKTGLDRKIAHGVKASYTQLVRYTKQVPATPVPELVFHGKDCPGHTTGLPASECLRGEVNPDGKNT